METSKLALANIIAIGLITVLSAFDLIRNKIARNKTNKRLLAIEEKVGIAKDEKAEEAKESEA